MPSFTDEVEAWHQEQRDQWATTNQLLEGIKTAQGGIMATLQDVIDAEQAVDDSVQAAASRVATDMQALNDAITALQAQVDSGTGVTAEDLQGLIDKNTAIVGEVSAIDAAVVEPPA
jgi:uncharacterized phage infection (PIP) family protein YhgE